MHTSLLAWLALHWYGFLVLLYFFAGSVLSIATESWYKPGQRPGSLAHEQERDRLSYSGSLKTRRAQRFWLVGGVVIAVLGLASGKIGVP